MPIFEELGDHYGIALIHLGLGVIAMSKGKIAISFDYLFESLLTLQEIGDLAAATECLERLAQLTHLVGHLHESAVLFEVVEQLRNRAGVQIQPAYLDDHVRHVSELRSQMGEIEFSAAFARGAATSVANAIDIARAIQVSHAEEIKSNENG